MIALLLWLFSASAFADDLSSPEELASLFDNRARLAASHQGALDEALTGQLPRVQVIKSNVGRGAPVYSAILTPDGAELLFVQGNSIHRRDLRGGGASNYERNGFRGKILHIGMSTGELVAATDDGQVVVWDKLQYLWASLSKRSLVQKGILSSPITVHSAEFSPDGTKIVLAQSNHKAVIWMPGAQKKLELKGHKAPVRYACFSPDGAKVLTASWDKTAALWDAQTGQKIREFKGHADFVNFASFSPDGTRIVTAGADQLAIVWDAESGKPFQTLRGHSGPVTSARFDPKGEWIVTAGADARVLVWDAKTAALLESFEGHEGTVWSAAFSRDGSQLVTASDDTTVRVWRIGIQEVNRAAMEKLKRVLSAPAAEAAKPENGRSDSAEERFKL